MLTAAPQQAVTAPTAQTRQAIHSVAATEKRSSSQPLMGLASTEPSVVMEKARLQAVADAAAKASQISKAFGVNLGTIASISYNTPISGSNETYIQPRMMSKGLMSNSIADSSVYSPDKLVFTDNVSVVYNLEQTKKN